MLCENGPRAQNDMLYGYGGSIARELLWLLMGLEKNEQATEPALSSYEGRT